MYLPKHFEVTDPDLLAQLIGEYPLATLIGRLGGQTEVNHLPLMLNSDRTRLYGHVAKNNPLLKIADQASSEVTAVFHGPNAYVTPSWYPSKPETGKVVPTWNYAVVHVQGNLGLMGDLHWMRNHVSQMTDTHEPTYQSQWKLNDAPEEYVQMMLNAIVGIEIRISSLVGKFKLSQNRSAQDYAGVLEELKHSSNRNLQGMAKYMKPD